MTNFLENIILDKKIREIDVASHLSVKKSKVLTNFLDISILDRKIREILLNLQPQSQLNLKSRFPDPESG